MISILCIRCKLITTTTTLLTQLYARYHYNSAAHPVVCTVPLQQLCSPSCMHDLFPLQKRCSPSCMDGLLPSQQRFSPSCMHGLLPLQQRCSPSCMHGLVALLSPSCVHGLVTLLTQLYARVGNTAHPVVCTG